MRLDSARELKNVMLAEARAAARESLTVRSVRAARGARAFAAESIQVEHPAPVAAVGIAPKPGAKDFALAVRIFRGREAAGERMLKRHASRGGEIDVARGVSYSPRIALRAGGSCGHYRITAGTLGGFVEDGERYYILSNNHVLANSDDATVGDPILQPGNADIRNGKYDVIGHLDRWVSLNPGSPGGFDAAIAAFDDEIKEFYPHNYEGIGAVKGVAVSDRYETRNTIKRGRTTGVTRGTVSAFELDGVAINYGTRANPLIVTFDDQIEVVGAPENVPFSQPGDSGSFIIDADTRKPYALLYGGGPDAQGIDRTLGQFMPDVLAALNVRLVK